MRAGAGLGILAVIALGAFAAHLLLRSDPAKPQEAPTSEPTSALVQKPRHTTPAARAVLRVRVRAADWSTAMGGSEVAVYAHDPRSMELPHDPRMVRADEHGVVELTDLPRGSYLVCAPGARPGDEPPGTARIDVDPQSATAEAVVAAMPSAVDVDIDVQARFAPRYGVSTRLVLVRTDDASRRAFAFPRVVEPGEQHVVLRIPEGTYEVSTRPLGELVTRPVERLLRVSASSRTATLHLDENPSRLEVALRGIPDDELPVRVLPIEEGRVQDDRPQTSWWGAFRWASATATVPALEGEHRLAVFGRSHVYLAATAQRFASGRVEVELRRATRLLVDCPRWDPRRDSGATIAVDVAGESFLRVLLPTFGSERPDLDVPSLAGELILPRAGECAVECLRADGSKAFERKVTLDTDIARLHVDSM
ncbi:MAG: hypothetical protein U1F36_16250 [Planctomycetota bacterium]